MILVSQARSNQAQHGLLLESCTAKGLVTLGRFTRLLCIQNEATNVMEYISCAKSALEEVTISTCLLFETVEVWLISRFGKVLWRRKTLIDTSMCNWGSWVYLFIQSCIRSAILLATWQLWHSTWKPIEQHQTLPYPWVILKAIHAGVGWIRLPRLNQGLIKPLKAARGHVMYRDGKMLSITKIV